MIRYEVWLALQGKNEDTPSSNLETDEYLIEILKVVCMQPLLAEVVQFIAKVAQSQCQWPTWLPLGVKLEGTPAQLLYNQADEPDSE